MPDNQIIAAVIVTYNRLNKLKVTIEKSLECGFDKIIVIDNGTTDGTTDWLNTLEDETLITVRLEDNIGGSGGFYEGFKFAVNNLNVDWICCYDDDAYPVENAIDKIRDMNLEGVYGVCAAVFLKNNDISEMNRPYKSPYRRFGSAFKTILKGDSLNHMSDSDFYSNRMQTVDGCSFVGFFLNMKYIHQTNEYPDPDLFIYSDDSIYTCQMTRSGYNILFNPNIQFIHDCETLSGNGLVEPVWKTYYLYRNGLFWLKKESYLWYLVLMPVKLLIWIKRGLGSDKKAAYYKLTFISVLDAISMKKNKSLKDVINLLKGM